MIVPMLIGLTIATTMVPYASTAAAALQERVLAYQTMTRFNLEIHVQVYPEGSNREPPRDFFASVQRDGSRMLRVFQHLIVLSTEQCTITVDNSRLLILFSERKDVARTVPIGTDALAILKSLTGRPVEPRVTQVDDDTWFVEEPKRLPGQKVRIAFDHQNHQLKEVGYLPNVPGPLAPGPVLVRYEWKDVTAIDPSQLSEERFVIHVNGRLEPASGFKGYQLKRIDIDQAVGGR
jgi:hypothetical protein